MNEYQNWLITRIETMERAEKELNADGRRDEGIFTRVRCNIYGVAKTIYEVMERNCAPEDVARVYREKLDRLPEGWRESLAQAKAHGDDRTAFLEEVKLETLAEIRSKFEEVGHG